MEDSIINSFPGYEFVIGDDNKPHNMYRGVDLGFGGYIYAKPGMYGNVAVLDSASHHPTSIIRMNCFGEYTKNYKDLLDARVAIKHGNIDKVKTMLGGKLAKYITDKDSIADLSYALKIALNSTYGLTSANFDNPFRDVRNKNNIVALRGALFLKTLHDAVVEQGYDVIACKTDSIKIPDATPDIIQFVMDFGKKYGYTFEHEETYERMCLINAADFVAKIKGGKHDGEWTVTGAQFAVPYVFKKLFSKEEIIFDDMCETKSVTSALYLDMNEHLPDVSEQEKTVAFAVKKAKKFGVTIDISKPTGDGELDPLLEEIAKGHNYRFIGKVGQFCPIKKGHGGGILLRETTNKKTGEKGYAAATGSKGYRWLESEMVSELGKEDNIDRSYYDKMVDEAVKSISEYGDFEWFVSDEPYISPVTASPSEGPGVFLKFFRPKSGEPRLINCGKLDCSGCEYWENTNTVDGKLTCDAGYECLPF